MKIIIIPPRIPVQAEALDAADEPLLAAFACDCIVES